MWGFPIPAPPSWLPTGDPTDEVGYTVGDDPADRWE